ncbi:MAG: VCBS repeat-containing protein [Ignavibacteriales bacterium]|nr:VCBS repeat-containing protein [Ignavibacteriales bacterium]
MSIRLRSSSCDAGGRKIARVSAAALPRFVATTAFSLWLAIEPSQGQARDIAFGSLRRIGIPQGVDRGRILHDPATKSLTALVWTAREEVVHLSTVDATLSSFSFRKLSTPMAVDEVLVADVTNDRRNDLLYLNKEQRLLQIAGDMNAASPKIVSTLKLGFEPSEVVVGDLNNDKRLDLIFLTEKNQGVVNYIGDGRGGFKEGKIIAPDNAISRLVLAHLNNDNIIDLVTFDWVRSELHLLYGVGRGRFVDQTVFPVDGDVRDLLVVEKGKDGYLDLVLVMKKPSEIQYWEGNGLGDFRKQEVVPVSEEILDVALGDVDGDHLADLVVLRQGALDVYFNAGENPLKEKISYACPASAVQLFVLDANGDKRTEGLLLGTDGTMTVFMNGNQPHMLKDSLEFAAGLQPAGVWAGIVNNDNFSDVVVVNEKSGTLSLFAGTETGLLGQSSYPLFTRPQYLVYHSATDTTSRFLVSHPESKSLSFFSINLLDNSTVNAVIPTDGESEVLFSRVNEKNQAEFFCSNTASPRQDASLSYYLRIGTQTFLERSYRLVGPNALLGVTVSGANSDSHIDLVYVVRSTESDNLDVGVAVLDSALEVKERVISRELVTLPDRKSYLWTADLDADDTLDLVVAFPEESKSLYVLKGGSKDLFGEPQLLSGAVSMSHRHQLQVADMDGDGLPDFVVNNSEERAIGWFRNKQHMSFEAWQPLVASGEKSHFSLSDINRDGLLDIALTSPGQGTVKIYSGNALLKHGSSKTSR